MDSPGSEYAPDLREERLVDLVSQIKDWQINHGSLLKLVRSESEHSVLSYPVGVSVSSISLPLPAGAIRGSAGNPRDIQPPLLLSLRILSGFITPSEISSLSSLLQRRFIYEAARDAGPVQDVFVAMSASALKQVEFNTFSCAGVTHANKVADMHRYLTL